MHSKVKHFGVHFNLVTYFTINKTQKTTTVVRNCISNTRENNHTPHRKQNCISPKTSQTPASNCESMVFYYFTPPNAKLTNNIQPKPSQMPTSNHKSTIRYYFTPPAA